MVECSLPIVLRAQGGFRDQHKSKLPQPWKNMSLGQIYVRKYRMGMSISKDEHLYFTKIKSMGADLDEKVSVVWLRMTGFRHQP